jgi:alkylation response protein AidB-like acyl-CoA dehydrogenase
MSDIGWVEPHHQARAQAVAEFLQDTAPLARVRSLAEAGGQLDGEHIGRAAQAGVLLPLLSESSVVAACPVLDQWGRSLAAAPVVELNVVADLLRESAVPEALSGGKHVATWASSALPGYWGSGASISARTAGDSLILNGTASLVPHAADADVVLVAVSDGAGVSQLLVSLTAPGLELTRLEALDLTRARYRLRFRDVEVPRIAVVGGSADGSRQAHLGVVLSLAQTIGAMGELFERALDYAKSRIAFGRPIGSFQAVKHLLVDAGLALEMSRAMCDAAAQAMDSGAEDTAEVVSMAKAFVSKAGIELAHTCWQVFGGVAYQWDHDFHLFLRRITSDAALFGSADWHQERIFGLHAEEVSA